MIIITGPTSSGKTSLSIKLCKEFGGEIISADSRQIYKYLDVGTGKKPLNKNSVDVKSNDNYWELNGVKIHMYDVTTPDQEYSSVDFARDSKRVISQIEENNKVPFVVGGTGFYIDALTTDNIESNVPSNFNLRKTLEKQSIEELQNLVNPTYLKTLNNSDKNNKVRLIRAIEIFKATNKWPRNNTESQEDPSESNLIIELTASREYLYARADKWVQEIWRPLLEEVKEIKKLGYYNSNPMNGLIYKTAKGHIEGQISESDAIERIKFDIHKYIRRQQTWFKRYKNSIKVDISEKSFDMQVMAKVKSYLDGR